MGRYILKRLLMTLVVIFMASIVIFTVVYFVPGDPVKTLMGPQASPAEVEARRAALGLDQPYFTQLGNFLYNAFIRFDLGESWTKGIPVMQGLMERIPYTLLLGFTSVVLSVIIAIPLGVTAAIHQNGLQDRGSSIFAMILISVPNFWLALLMIMLFSQKLHLLPSFGVGGVKYYILPVVACTVSNVGILIRQTRSSMLEVCRADYVTTARAKGVKEKFVIYHHMLPNALIPIITVIGISLSNAIAGTVVIEQIFSMPGIGTYLTQAVSSRDYPIIRGCVIVLAAITALLMLVVDLVYAMVDPRIKAQYVGKGRRRKYGKK